MGGVHASCVPEEAGHIVVVGGGYAGVELAVLLKKWGVKYTVIDKQDCLHHNIANSRALVNAECIKNMFIPLNEVFGENFIHAKVVDVDTAGKKVILSDDRQIDYDTLVMCTGPKLGFPAKAEFTTKAEGIEVFTQYMEKVTASKRILVVGGGAVGVEVAAEIAEAHPDKELTIIHSNSLLCHPDANQKFQKKIHKMVTDLGIKLILDERVTNLEELRQEGEVTAVTDKETSVTADMAIICVGGSSRERDAFGSSLEPAMNEHGSLNVNEFFQVDGHEDVFAIGDCTSVQETKLALYAEENAKHLAANLKRRVEKKPMKPYKPNNAPVLIGVTVGTKHGVIQMYNGFILPEMVIRKLKCNDMMMKRVYDKVGLKLPK